MDVAEIIEIFSSVEGDSESDKLKKVCDQVKIKSTDIVRDIDFVPKDPNIFLAFQIPGITSSDICFVCLEREINETFYCSLWTKQKKAETNCKRTAVWQIREDIAPKILKAYFNKVESLKKDPPK